MQTDPTRTAAQITRLLSAFPPTGSTDPDETLRRYFEAIDEFTLWDIETAVDWYIKGKVPGFDGRFAPTPPMLAGQARRARDERLSVEARERRALPPPAEEEVPKDPKIASGLRQLVKKLEENMLSPEASLRKRHHVMARANARFEPNMDPDAMMKRLGGRPPRYEVGDPEGNTDAGEAA